MYDALSRGKNKDITDAIANNREDVEDPEQWESFSNWKDYDNLTEGEGLEILSSCIFNFAACIVCAARLPKLADWGVVALSSWLTVDDIAFLLVTIENCVNKWIRSYRFLSAKRKSLEEKGQWSEADKLLDIKLSRPAKKRRKGDKPDTESELSQMKALPGTKFEVGSGVSGPEGQRRFECLKLYIYRNYFDKKNNHDVAEANEAALNAALRRLVAEETQHTRRAMAKKQVVTPPPADPPQQEVMDLRDFEWASLFQSDPTSNNLVGV